MRRILISFSTKIRIDAISDFLQSHGGREVLLVAPSRTACDEVVRALGLQLGDSFGVHRLTLAALAVESAGPVLAASGISLLTGVAVEALAARAVASCRARQALKWFEPVADTPGFFRALASTLTELRMNDVSPTGLAASGPAGADLALLLAAFEETLSESRVADLAAIFKAAATAPSRYSSMPTALLDLTPRCALEWRFLAWAVRNSESILATAHPRHETAVRDLQQALGATAELIESGGVPQHGLDRLRVGAFSVEPPPAGEFDASIDFRSASDESREAVEIARSITGASRTGIPFDRVAILLRNPDAYQPLMEDALRRAGIPAFFTQGSRRPNPAGRAFLALLGCAAEGLSASRFGEYLSLGQVPEPETSTEPAWVPIQGELFAAPVEDQTIPDRKENQARAPHAWEHLLVDAAVIGGRDRWERRLRGLDRELEKQIIEVRDEDEGLAHKLERRRTRLKDLTAFALPLIDELAALPTQSHWQGWLTALEHLATSALRQSGAVLTVLAELRPMAKIGPVMLDEVVEVLTNRLTSLRVEPAERRYGKVYVATIPEIAGMSFDTVFVPGFGEDLFPKRASEDPLLLDATRVTVSADLPVQDTRVADERMLFHLAASTAERTLLVSFPRMNLAQARARGPSFYALEVVRAVTGKVPDLQELQRKAAESSPSQAGWPSPRSPEAAIDDAEYDLALVGQLLRAPIEEARGRGRYLLTASATLARSLRTRAGRWRRPWVEGDGVVNASEAVLAVLAKHRPAERSYSATALQTYAACPYRFLLHAIHRLQPREEIAGVERMDALTRGSLFHAIQFRLLSELRNRELLPVTSDNHGHILTIADVVIDDVAGEYSEDLAPAIPKIWESEVEDIRWDVRGWLREMKQGDLATAWTPKWFELSFGLPPGRESDPSSSPDPVGLAGGLKLRGSIDMIEERDGKLRVTDHKTGRAPTSPPGLTGRGEVLQPILYAQAAEALLGMPVETARLSYCTERGGYRNVDVPVTDEARDAMRNVVAAVDSALGSGFLPAYPREGACDWCDYRVVCGPYEEIRVRRKPKDRLAGLEQVRRGV